MSWINRPQTTRARCSASGGLGDIADYFLQPMYFGVKTVEFKIGSELDILNRGLSGLHQAKRLGFKSLDWPWPVFRALIHVASLFGTSQGGVVVQVSVENHIAARSMSLGVLVEESGEVIPAILPSVATQMILQGEVTCAGIVPLPDWLPRTRLTKELTKRQVRNGSKNRR